EAVRSCHVPRRPSTLAWPPSLPSVPTSRATRVTSAENDDSWSTIAFTTAPMRWNSPFTGRPSIVSAIFWLRSPSATADSTRATSFVGRTRSSINPFVAATAAAHEPEPPSIWTRSSIRPSRPTTRATRVSSRVSCVCRWISALTRRASSPCTPPRRVATLALSLPASASASAWHPAHRNCSAESPPKDPLAGVVSTVVMARPDDCSRRTLVLVPRKLPLTRPFRCVPSPQHLYQTAQENLVDHVWRLSPLGNKAQPPARASRQALSALRTMHY